MMMMPTSKPIFEPLFSFKLLRLGSIVCLPSSSSDVIGSRFMKLLGYGVWSEDDEIQLIKGMINYVENKDKDHIAGESFYNPYISGTLDLLREKGLIEESEGAQVIFIEGKKIPLIVVKRDGETYAACNIAFGYTTPPFVIGFLKP
ncbi:hypothetical protein L6452_04820 [Arctium lappa]|uniref:Uncharacterized protein n=1 Tax=Arctium lappa TaxID=4217 RepID=A0ACB9EFR5_ARCLA|nr:hypothetical protein L6452_04820 [Arctium lappa]